MTYNEWCNYVQFGIGCDRNKFQTFIDNYENSRFIQKANAVQKDCDAVNSNIDNLPRFSLVSYLVQLIKS